MNLLLITYFLVPRVMSSHTTSQRIDALSRHPVPHRVAAIVGRQASGIYRMYVSSIAPIKNALAMYATALSCATSQLASGCEYSAMHAQRYDHYLLS